MLESQLADMAVLDPLAQDARRLGRHLPDLIDRYERVPAEYRAERDGEGLNVDERLVQGLDAATGAIDELGRKLARDDVDAFQTQGRFIEDRYREDGPIGANEMSFELERVLYETEDFLRRAIGSPTRRAAKKRRMQRKMEEIGRRARRSGFVIAGLMLVLLGVSLYSPGLFLAWIFAVPIILFFGIVLMFQPTRQASAWRHEARLTPQTLPLPELAVRAEEGLLDRCDELPGRALPAADRIMANLREIQPHLHEFGPGDEELAGEIRRLAGQHLPQLVDSYLALPAQTRAVGQREQPPRHREPRHRRRRDGPSARTLLPRAAERLRHPQPLHRDALPGG